MITQNIGELLPHRFTFSTYLIKSVVVYFLLHCPLGYPSHQLDGTLLHGSPDFPLEQMFKLLLGVPLVEV